MSEQGPAPSSGSIPVSAAHWFWRGFMVGVLLCGAITALSYPYRTGSFRPLLNANSSRDHAIGLPLEMWRRGPSSAAALVDARALAIDLGAFLGFSVVCGAVAWGLRRTLTAMVYSFEQQITATQKSSDFQFSLRGLMSLTLVLAVTIAAGRHWADRVELLAAIYFAGPWVLVALAMLPHKIHWQHRVVLVTLAAPAMILAAIYVGSQLKPPLDFERVLLGIFVFWTPQSALAAVGLTIAILATYHYRLPRMQAVQGRSN